MPENSNKNVLGIIFSDNRALQLDAVLSSFYFNCLDSENISLKVIYKGNQERYKILENQYKSVEFIEDKNFKEQIISNLSIFNYFIFMNDNTFFINSFSIEQIKNKLENQKDAIGFSLKLGKNINYVYQERIRQEIPELIPVDNNIFKFNLATAKHSFNNLSDLTEMVYRTEDFLPSISKLNFNNLENLNYFLHNVKSNYIHSKKILFCFERSVAFQALPEITYNYHPSNILFNVEKFPLEKLDEIFDNGNRIKTSVYKNMIPISVTSEIKLYFTNKNIEFKPKYDLIFNDKNNPLISVVIPCYKQAIYLHDAVKSMAAQTYDNFEIIIVNDGSPDNTSNVSNELMELYPYLNIKLVEKTNGGVCDARNKGIESAKGQWILPFDADDMFDKSFFQEAVEIIKNNSNINLITTNLVSFGDRISHWRPTDYTPEVVPHINTFINSSMYKKELWEKTGGYNPVIPWGGEDWNFWITCSEIGINYYRIEKNLFLYRTHKTSTVTIMMEHFDEMAAFIRTLHPKLYNKKLLEESYEKIADMPIETIKILEKKLELFPENPILYFWFGLYYEKKNKLDKALKNYIIYAEKSNKYDWQPFYKLSVFYKNLNKLEETKVNFLEYKKRVKLSQALL